jgi:spermidine synthase
MKIQIPRWKRWWSYVSEIKLEETYSSYNEYLCVSLQEGRIQLSTSDAIYSFADKYDNFRHAFERLKLPEKANVLLLGFGLGSIPFMLEKKFGKLYTYTGVEIDSEVIRLASKYVLPELSGDITLVEADARVFLMQDTTRYDLIAMDIFVGSKVPEDLQTTAYLELLRESLSEDGILIFNMLASQPADRKHVLEYFERVFKTVFPEGGYMETGGNLLLLNDTGMVIK